MNHNALAGPGLEDVEKVFASVPMGVHGLKVFAEEVFLSADASRVVGCHRYADRHTRNFLAYPATGNAFAMRSTDIWPLENERFVDYSDVLNTLQIFIQVGAVPPPCQPS